MLLQIMIILLITALFQVLGTFITWLCVKRLKKHHNLILIAEIIIMVLISVDIIFLSIKRSLIPLYGVIAGFIFVFVLNMTIPHKHEDRFQRLGLLVFAAMCIHEFPEGIAVGSMYLINVKMSIVTAALIALHNLPEGSIIAMPYLLKNKAKKAFSLTIVTQILYIIGGLTAYFLLVSLSATIQATAASFAAGAMLFIAFEELKFLN